MPGQPECLAGFGQSEAREIAQLDQFRANGIVSLEIFERLIERQDIDVRRLVGDQTEIDLRPPPIPAALEASLPASAIDHNPAHGLGRGGEEVPAAIPMLDLFGIDQSNVGLMHECSRLERLAWFFLRQPSHRQLRSSS